VGIKILDGIEWPAEPDYMAWLTRLLTRRRRRRFGACLMAVPGGRVKDAAGRRRRVAPFELDVRPVTNGEYLLFAQETGREMPQWMFRAGFDDPRQPVVGVNHADASAFARWAGKRLPTAKEWLRAARGNDTRAFPWGEGYPEAGHAHFDQGQRGGPAQVIDGPERPGGAGPFGHLDLAGNVWEWCSDGVLLGGFWGSKQLCLDEHLQPIPADTSAGYGFRCAL